MAVKYGSCGARCLPWGVDDPPSAQRPRTFHAVFTHLLPSPVSRRVCIVTDQASSGARIGPDSYLTLHYRVSLIEGEGAGTDVVNTFDDKPATLQLGAGQLADALEHQLLGMTTGDYAVFELAAGEAFGPRNPELVQKVARAALDANSEEGNFANSYQPGDMVQFSAPGGGSYTGVLKQLGDEYALFDFNHPLAGQPVRFEVRIIGVM